MASALYSKVNYTAPIDYMISAYIREYDISKANITILFEAGVIDYNEYIRYYNMDKIERQIQIGLLLKSNPEISEVLKAGIINAKKLFFEANDIQDYQVLAIKNDAVFITNTSPIHTQFGNIKFVCKNEYTSFYKIQNKEYYYYLDSVNGKENLDIKGISDLALVKHKPYFLDFLLTIFDIAQTSPIEEAIAILRSFYLNYINMNLDIGYYRRFDSLSNYDINLSTTYSTFGAPELGEDQKSIVDNSYNLRILVDLYKIYSNIYFQKTNRR